MKWRIDYSREAEKFLKRPDVHVSVVEELKKFLTTKPKIRIISIGDAK